MPAPACPARCAGTPCVKCRSRTSLSVLSDVSDRRQGAGRPADVAAAQVVADVRAEPSICCPGDSPEDPHHRRQLRPGRRAWRVRSPPRAATWRCAPVAPTGSTSSKPNCRSSIRASTSPSRRWTSTTTSQVPKVFAELSDELGGIDRVIVNAGIGKGAKLGSGKLWANKATIETNLVAALVQIETALEMFNNARCGPPGADLLGARQQGRAGRQGRLRREQGRGELAGRIAARRIRQGARQGFGHRARLHRVGDDGQVEQHNVDGGQRNWRQCARRRHGTRARPSRGAVVAVGAAGAGDAGAAAAAHQVVRLS